ncbi:MAG: hypothetical protein AAF399_29425 [Bacteroidota bacterium]
MKSFLSPLLLLAGISSLWAQGAVGIHEWPLIQDEVWRENDLFAGSIHPYRPDSATCVVPISAIQWLLSVRGFGCKINPMDRLSSKSDNSPQWHGGFSCLTFFDIEEAGYSWKGGWGSAGGSMRTSLLAG